MELEQYRSTQELERHLGAPVDGTRPFSFQRVLELDEQEEFPQELCTLLARWGFYDYLVPRSMGGRLHSFEESLSLVRALSRRDLTVAIGAGVGFLGALPVWLSGTPAQRQALSQKVKSGQPLALALSERNHGSDLMATETSALPGESGFELSGEKWLINGATRARTVTVLAKTDPAGGPRGLSFLLVDKDALASDAYCPLPKVKTLGIRGADISGLRFDKARLPAEALIGKPGEGLEIGLKALQLSRTMCAAFSLGAGDTALRATMAWARQRELYGTRVIDLGTPRRALAQAYVDFLLCDAMSVAAARSMHVVPEQMSTLSSIVKYLVPTAVEELTHSLAVVLGARYYLREGHWSGIFQKVLRDVAVVSFFDGNTAVNLHSIALQLKQLVTPRPSRNPEEPARLVYRLSEAHTLVRPLGEFDPSRLTLMSRGYNDSLNGLEGALDMLRQGGLEDLDAKVAGQVLERASILGARLEQLRQRVLGLHASLGLEFHRSAEAFDAAREYTLLHAGASCLHLWLGSRPHLGAYFARGEWLVLCLSRVLEKLGQPLPAPTEYYERTLGELEERCESGRMLGAVALPLM